MTLKAVVLTLALVAVTGTRAEVSADQVATVVWNYFRQLGNNAKAAVEDLQKSELPQQLKKPAPVLLEDPGRIQNITSERTGHPHGKGPPRPLAQAGERKAVRSRHLQLRPAGREIETHTQGNSLVCQPFAQDKLRTEVRAQTEKLRDQLSPYARHMETMLRDQKDNLQASLEPMADELQGLIDQNVKKLKGQLTPYADNLKEQIDKHVETLRQNLAPFAEGAQEKLNHQLEALAWQMKKDADFLKNKLQADADQLGRSLAPLAENVRSKMAGGATDLQEALAHLGTQLDLNVEQFRRSVEPHGEAFNKILVQQVKELNEKLYPDPDPDSGDGQRLKTFLEMHLRDKVNSFFSSLQKPGQDQPLQEGQDQPLQEGQDQPLAPPLPEQTPEQ
uniref:Apolipoprotein A-IV n=1 Tax=Myotis lucifugus TaxID=59463 RepID=G1PKJ5_MYOLU